MFIKLLQTDISVFIWDFDNTLYRQKDELAQQVREAEYAVIENHTDWNREKVLTEFNTIFPSTYKSATEAAAHLAHITVVEAAAQMERLFERTNYLEKDDRLIETFSKLKTVRHYLLVNGIRGNIQRAVEKLGLAPSVFADIVTSEIVGVNKPNSKGFQYIVEHSGVPAEAHLMIGDRIPVDLEPAKKLGMKTCWIYWGHDLKEANDQVVDICIPTVYEFEKIVS